MLEHVALVSLSDRCFAAESMLASSLMAALPPWLPWFVPANALLPILLVDCQVFSGWLISHRGVVPFVVSNHCVDVSFFTGSVW